MRSIICKVRNHMIMMILLSLSSLIFCGNFVFANTVYAPPYNLKKGHTIYLASLTISGYTYGKSVIKINGQQSSSIWAGWGQPNGLQKISYDNSNLRVDPPPTWTADSSSPVWYTSTDDSTTIAFGIEDNSFLDSISYTGGSLSTPTQSNASVGILYFHSAGIGGLSGDITEKFYEFWKSYTAPTGTIKINNGAKCTNSRNVTLNLTAQTADGSLTITQMSISNDNDNWTTVPFTTSYAWSLPSTLKNGDQATVYVKFKDSLDTWSQVYQATITFSNLPDLGMYQDKMTALQQSIQNALNVYTARRAEWLKMLESSQESKGATLMVGNPKIDGVLYLLNKMNKYIQTDTSGSLLRCRGLFILFNCLDRLSGVNDPAIMAIRKAANGLLGFSYLFNPPDPSKPVLIMLPGAGGEPMWTIQVHCFLQAEAQNFNIIGYTFDPTQPLANLARGFTGNLIVENLSTIPHLIVCVSYGNTILHTAILQALQNNVHIIFQNSYVLSLGFVAGGSASFLKPPSWFPQFVLSVPIPAIEKYAQLIIAMNPSNPQQANIANNINAIQQATKGIFYIQAIGDPYVDQTSTASPYAQQLATIFRSLTSSNSEFVLPPSAESLGIKENPHSCLLYVPQVQTRIETYIDLLNPDAQTSHSPKIVVNPSSVIEAAVPNALTDGDDDDSSISNPSSDSDTWLSDVTLDEISPLDLGSLFVVAIEEDIILQQGNYDTDVAAIKQYLTEEPDWTFDALLQYANQYLETNYDADYLDEPDFNAIGGQNVVLGQTPSFNINTDTGAELDFNVSAQSPSGEPFILSALNLPAEASFNQGTFRWRPQPYQAATFTVIFTATDARGLMSYLPVQIIAGNGNDNIIPSWSGSIKLDPQLPVITASNGSKYPCTNNQTVNLNISANETLGLGISFMQFSLDGNQWSQYQPFAGSAAYTLPKGTGDGIHKISVRFRDVVGNWSPVYNASFILDTTPPTGTITINNGASSTKSMAVTLNLSAQDNLTGVKWVEISNDQQNWTSVLYKAKVAWTLLAGQGTTKTVYVKFQDNAGNCSKVYSASIIVVDTTPPRGSIKINAGAKYTNSTAVTLTLAATDTGSGVSGMAISNDKTTWTTANYSTSYKWTLASSAKGKKTVYVKFQDNAGNWSTVYSASITIL